MMAFGEYLCGLLIALITIPMFLIGLLFGAKAFGSYLKMKAM